MEEFEEILDALEYWASNPKVCVDQNNIELPWNDRSKGTWKDLWEIQTFYTYDCVVGVDLDQKTSLYNFDLDSYHHLGSLLRNIWFSKAEKLGFPLDNKTALKLHNILTNETVFMGWYDGRLSVSKREPHKFSCCTVYEVKN